jgi:ATP-dependent DNA helicase RecQ
VKEKTILSNLKKFVDDGHQIDPTEVLAASSLSERKKDEVYEAMEKVGPKLLRPIYDALDKTVDYNELRILQLAYFAMNGD